MESQADQGEAHGWRQVFKKKGQEALALLGRHESPSTTPHFHLRGVHYDSILIPGGTWGPFSFEESRSFAAGLVPYGRLLGTTLTPGFTSAVWQW